MHRNVIVIIPVIRTKGCHSSPLIIHSLHIKIRIAQLRLSVFIVKNRTLRKKRPVLQHHNAPAEYNILRGFAVSCADVNVVRKSPCRNGRKELLPVGILSHRLVGGRKIHNQIGPRHRMGNMRCVDYPGVFADFAGHRKSPHGVHIEQNMTAKGNCLSAIINQLCLLRSGSKLPRLIKLRIIWQEPLGNKCKKPSILQCSRRIVELAAVLQRKPDKNKSIHPRRCPANGIQRFFRSCQQHILQKQIIPRITSNGKLRENDNVRPV